MGMFDLIKCTFCGEYVEEYALRDYKNILCRDCVEKLQKHPILWKWYHLKVLIRKCLQKIKFLFSKLLFFCLLGLLGIGFVVFIFFWIKGCAGNALNVDENPVPGLHWKPNR